MTLAIRARLQKALVWAFTTFIDVGSHRHVNLIFTMRLYSSDPIHQYKDLVNRLCMSTGENRITLAHIVCDIVANSGVNNVEEIEKSIMIMTGILTVTGIPMECFSEQFFRTLRGYESKPSDALRDLLVAHQASAVPFMELLQEMYTNRKNLMRTGASWRHEIIAMGAVIKSGGDPSLPTSFAQEALSDAIEGLRLEEDDT